MAATASAPTTAGADTRRSPPAVRRARLRGHLAQRHRRGRGHPPAEPVAPLRLEGGAVPGGVRGLARATGSSGSTTAVERAATVGSSRWTGSSTPVSSSSWRTRSSCVCSAARRSRTTVSSPASSPRCCKPQLDAACGFFEREMDDGPLSPPRPAAAHAHRLRADHHVLQRSAVSRGADSATTRWPSEAVRPGSTMWRLSSAPHSSRRADASSSRRSSSAELRPHAGHGVHQERRTRRNGVDDDGRGALL